MPHFILDLYFLDREYSKYYPDGTTRTLTFANISNLGVIDDVKLN